MEKKQLAFRVVTLFVFGLHCYSPNNFKQFLRYLGTVCLSLPQNNIDTIIYSSRTNGADQEAFFHFIEYSA